MLVCLKSAAAAQKSAKQAEASLAILQKILPIVVRLRPNPRMAGAAVLPRRHRAAGLRDGGACASAAACGKPARSGVIKLSEPDIQTA